MQQRAFTPSVLTHGLQPTCHTPCSNAVRYMTCGQGSSGFISLHHSGRVSSYYPDGRLRDSPPNPGRTVPYAGLTSTGTPERLLGWGPGATLALLDAQLHTLALAPDPLDITVCQVGAGCDEVVTAGRGNVCVWRAAGPECVLRVVEGFFGDGAFTQLALVPATRSRGVGALLACGAALTLVDLTLGRVLEHRTNLHRRNITGLVYCPQQDAVVSASEDWTIRVWGFDWELLMVFVGHSAVVTSLLLCPLSGLLLSSSLDGTLRCWSLQVGDQVQVVSMPGGCGPPLALGGPSNAATFFTFSKSGVTFWTFTSLYRLHCRLGGASSQPVRQIWVPPSPPKPYPARVLCVRGDSDVTVVSVETGAVLTSFRANGRVRSAEYCLPKEVLLVLTEQGTVIRGSTLTNPVMVRDELCVTQLGDYVIGQVREEVGLACCMALYNDEEDWQRALETWRSLQNHRGFRLQNKSLLDDDRFLVVFGHRGGSVSVMQMNSGRIQCRVSAHNDQDVTIIQAYPKSSCLLTAGDDKAVVVWRVVECVQECLRMQWCVSCTHTPVSVALLDSVLAIALQEAHSATCRLLHYSVDTHSCTQHPAEHDHRSAVTGLCVSQKRGVLFSCSRDRTVRIWDEENVLLSVLELNAELESVQCVGERGELLLGIGGDLYHTHYTHLLPHTQLLSFEDECDSELFLPHSLTVSCKQRDGSSPCSEEQRGEVKDPVLECEEDYLERDLRWLLSGDKHCCRNKTELPVEGRSPVSEPGEASSLMYGEEEVNMNTLTLTRNTPSKHSPKPSPPAARLKPLPHLKWAPPLHHPPSSSPSSILTPSSLHTLAPAPPSSPPTLATAPPSSLPTLALAPPSSPPTALPSSLPTPATAPPSSPPTVPPSSPSTAPPSSPPTPPTALPLLPPKRATPAPRSTPKSHVLLIRPQLSSPHLTSPPTAAPPPDKTPPPAALQDFLQQFVQEPWFNNIYTDQSCIPQSLSPAEFCVELLNYMKMCSVSEKLCVLTAIITLHTHTPLSNTHTLTQSLLTTLRTCLHQDMSGEEQCFVGELLRFVVCLDSHSSDVIVELLSLLAHRQLRLQTTAVCVLCYLGLDALQHCLSRELELWNSAGQEQHNSHDAVRETCCHWLQRWSRHYRKQKRLESSAVVSAVEVLHHFCDVQRKAQKQLQLPAEGMKDTVVLDTQSHRRRAVLRLGETYSTSRTREAPRLRLPPLVSRPQLAGFPLLVSLPLARITLCTMPFALRPQNPSQPRTQRYFMVEQSYTHHLK